jgi:hypothetical protein
MAAGPIQLVRESPGAWRGAAAGLIVAAAIVGIAITAGGSTARTLNGVGAIVWIASGVVLALTLPGVERKGLGWLAVAAAGLVLGGIVRPGTITEAIITFGIAGAVVVLAAGDRSGSWAFLVPAIYLPVHLLIGIGRALLRESGVRTDPPPTPAILPLVMILSAALAGSLVAALLRSRR